MTDTRRARRLVLAGASALIMLGGAVATNATAGADRGHSGHATIRVKLRDVDGRVVGWVSLRQTRHTVVVSGVARGLAPGFHGFHIHAVGVCDPAAPAGPFTSAGGHFNPGQLGHSEHAGDMPSLLVTEDGYATTTFATDRFRVGDLRDADGSAVMVHAGRDNFANIPDRYSAGGVPGPDAATRNTGDSGDRVACGVIASRTR